MPTLGRRKAELQRVNVVGVQELGFASPRFRCSSWALEGAALLVGRSASENAFASSVPATMTSETLHDARVPA
jgi:hypothetical protein